MEVLEILTFGEFSYRHLLRKKVINEVSYSGRVLALMDLFPQTCNHEIGLNGI